MSSASAASAPISRPIAPLPAAARRLLDALGSQGASVALDPFDETRVVARASRGGVTLTIASARLEDAAALVAAGLCSWSQEPGGARLVAVSSRPTRGPLEAARPAPEPQRAERGAARLVDAAESPLAWLARRRGKAGVAYLDAAAFQAGERLRRDLELARMLPRTTQSWSAPGGGGGHPGEATEVSLAAGQRARRALAAVGGELSGLLIDVCGFLKGLETIEAERGWPKRSGKVVLRIALDRLAAHYGLSDEAKGRAGAPTRVWRESGAQP
ncbi:MAG: ATPase [Rhodoblastus sp.]|nr:MAG: ATPase [Rhodoblastus sp.]